MINKTHTAIHYTINIEYSYVIINKEIIKRKQYNLVTNCDIDKAIEIIREKNKNIHTTFYKYKYIGSAIVEQHKVIVDGNII